jgi:hypothetical protein
VHRCSVAAAQRWWFRQSRVTDAAMSTSIAMDILFACFRPIVGLFPHHVVTGLSSREQSRSGTLEALSAWVWFCLGQH